MKTRAIVAVLGASALAVAPCAVQAADNDRIAEASEAMLQESEIPSSFGQTRGHVFQAQHKTGQRPWICSKGDNSLQGKKSPRMYESSYSFDSFDSYGRLELSQTVFAYKSTDAAAAAWKDLRGKAKKCSGESITGNWEIPGGAKYEQKLSNGPTDELYNGRTGWWVLSDFEASSAEEPWSEDEFVLFYRSGKTLQILDYDRRPDERIGMKRREKVEAIGVLLDYQWRHALGTQ